MALNKAVGSNVIVTGSEDSTIRMWNSNGELGDAITLPAQSVWSVTCLQNGDIVTVSSDAVVRVFTKDTTRYATGTISKAFTLAVEQRKLDIKAKLGGVKVTELPGPESLLKDDTEGQTKVVRHADGKIMCYQWTNNEWLCLGDVTVASGGSQDNSGEVHYEDVEYDSGTTSTEASTKKTNDYISSTSSDCNAVGYTTDDSSNLSKTDDRRLQNVYEAGPSSSVNLPRQVMLGKVLEKQIRSLSCSSSSESPMEVRRYKETVRNNEVYTPYSFCNLSETTSSNMSAPNVSNETEFLSVEDEKAISLLRRLSPRKRKFAALEILRNKRTSAPTNKSSSDESTAEE